MADLPSIYLGEADGGRIRVDNNAGGNGWFMDANGASESVFGQETSATRHYTDPASDAAGRVDLLTTILHEMGHAIGLPDSYAEQDRDSLMYGFLTKGERRLPAKEPGGWRRPWRVSRAPISLPRRSLLERYRQANRSRDLQGGD